MNVSLTKPLEEYVQKQVSTGLYSSASEVIRAGLRLLLEQEIDRKIMIGKQQIEQGKAIPFDDNYVNNLKERAAQNNPVENV